MATSVLLCSIFQYSPSPFIYMRHQCSSSHYNDILEPSISTEAHVSSMATRVPVGHGTCKCILLLSQDFFAVCRMKPMQVPSTDGDGGEAIGNAAPPKKEKGQARKERRAAEQDGSATDPGGMRSVGAYIHISRISDERIEHVEKAYKPGQKVELPYLQSYTTFDFLNFNIGNPSLVIQLLWMVSRVCVPGATLKP